MTITATVDRAGPGRVLRELALTGGALVGVVCLVFALLGATVDVRPLVFTSGSMAPTIRTGDLAVTRPVELAQVAPDDVVSVFDAHGMRVTHRVVEVDADRHQLRLKGDANDAADPQPYSADRVDRVLFSVPFGGYVLNWLSGPIATLLFGAYLVFLVWVLWPRSRPPQPGRRAAHRRSRSASGAALLLVAGLAAGGVPHPEPTLAAWTDSAPVSAALTAYTVPKPVVTGCSVSGLSVTITFSAVSSPYPVTYSAKVVETSEVLTVSGSGSTRTVTYGPAAQAMLGATHTIRITASPTGAPSWTSVAATQTVVLPLLVVPPLCGSSG
jgi:signal peptidase I